MPTSISAGTGRDHFSPVTFASLILIYISGLIGSSVIYMVDGRVTFVYAHLFFGATVLSVVALAAPARDSLWKPLLNDWSARALVGFVFYYALMIALYPEVEVAADHWRYLTVRMGVGFLIGYIAFAEVTGREAVGDSFLRHFPQKAFDWMNACALGVFLLALAFALWKMTPLIRNDIFLLEIPNERQMYQLFGDYLFLGFVGAVSMIWAVIGTRLHQSVAANILFTLLLACVSFVCFFLAQMAGSNLGAALIAAVGSLTGLHTVFAALRRRLFAHALVTLGVGLLIVTLAIAIVVNVPPLRIFGFQPVLQKNQLFIPPVASSSIESRLEIIGGGSDLSRFVFHSPIFGDLGSDRLFGKYIHSAASILTHLGLIGACAFLVYLIVRVFRMCRMPGNIIIKISSAVILVGAMIATFFPWMPLWVVVGVLYAAYSSPSTEKSK